LKLTKVK